MTQKKPSLGRGLADLLGGSKARRNACSRGTHYAAGVTSPSRVIASLITNRCTTRRWR